MAIIRGGCPIGELRGSIGAYTFSRNRAGAIVKSRAINVFPTGFMVKVKTSDSSSNNNATTFLNDAELLLDLVANTNYVIFGCCFFENSDAVTARSASLKLLLPTGANGYGLVEFHNGTANQYPRILNTNRWNLGTQSSNTISQSATGAMYFQASIIVGSTAGQVQVSWKPNVSIPANLTLKTGSYIMLAKQS